MAFLNSKMVMGYFPTPERVVERAARCVSLPDPGGCYHLLDPCCGEGLALAGLRRHLGAGVTFGIELDVARSAAAAARLDKVLGAGYADCRVSEEAAGAELLWLNPPYDDDDSKAGRLELTFLRETQQWLRPGGLLVYIVRQPHLTPYMAQRLSSWFDDLSVYRFPDPEYGAFQQVVALGVKRPAAREDSPACRRLLSIGKGGWLPALPETPDRLYRLPARDPALPWTFRPAQLPPAELSAEARRAGVWAGRFWQDSQAPPPRISGRPLMPLRVLHIALYIAAGLMDNAVLDDGRERLVVKGHACKVQVDVTSQEERDAGVERVQEQLRTALWALDLKRGRLSRIDDQAGFAAFVQRWRETLVELVQRQYPPLHQLGDVEPWQAQALDGLLRRKRLPGRRQSGLLPVQKEVAVAAYRAIKAYRVASLIMATGTGKTATSLGVARLLQVEQLHRRPGRPFCVVVMTEEHLPGQWVREVQQAVPMAFVAVAERVAGVTAFVRQAGCLDPTTLCVLIVPKSMAKLGSGWTGAAARSRRDAYLRCPDCGAVICRPDEEGHPSLPVTDPGWLNEKKRRCLAPAGRGDDPKGGVCGAALWQDVQWKRGQPWYPTGDRGFSRLSVVQAAVRAGRWNGLLDASQPPPARYPIADYIERALPGFFGLAIFDEAHRYNGDYTDQAYAYRALARAAACSLELTATVFNGKASSVFCRQYVQLPVLRRAYGWRERAAFVGHYGLLETVRKPTAEDEPAEVGVYSGKVRYRAERWRELPGIMPALLPLLLPTHIFLQLEDLGALLPGYLQRGQVLDCPEDVRRAYDALNDSCLEAMRQYPRIAGAWLQATLAYPSTPWHAEQVTATEYDEVGSRIGAVPVAHAEPAWEVRSLQLLPKEAWLLEYARCSTGQGRGVGVYLAHVHERGLPERLRWLLAQAGLPAEVLPESLGARQRNEWIRRQWAKGMRVLITHPGRVETGLNLLDFPSLVFYQPVYNLTTHIQAAGRAWRLGQRQECEVVFLYYRGTMEHRALALMDRKVKANAILTGNEEVAALAGEEEATAGAGFMAEVARQALQAMAVEDLGVMLRREQSTGWAEEAVIAAEERAARIERPPAAVVNGVQAGLFDRPAPVSNDGKGRPGWTQPEGPILISAGSNGKGRNGSPPLGQPMLGAVGPKPMRQAPDAPEAGRPARNNRRLTTTQLDLFSEG